MATVRVLAFAGARDAIGAHELELELGDASLTAMAVLDLVCARYPALLPYRSAIRVAVNGTYAPDDAAVAAGDEIALIPPVAGG
jgi:molybdopterin converting factor subunit 1